MSSEEEKKESCCSDQKPIEPLLEQINTADFSKHQKKFNDALLITATFEVSGMDCPSCAQSIEKHFRLLPWISEIQVQFSLGKCKVTHRKTNEDVIGELKNLGYQATLSTLKKTTSPINQKNKTLWISGLSLAFGLFSSYIWETDEIAIFFYALAILIGGYKPAKSAWYTLKNRSLDMNVLMVGATIGAATIGEWLEGATVVWLFALGNWLQVRSIDRTRNSIRGLMNLAPSEAWLKTDEGMKPQPVETIQIGQTIIVKPGEKIPLDGIVTAGATSVNQSPITGESIPIDKTIGEEVYAGTINETGSVEVKVTRISQETTLARIIHLVEKAQEKQAPMQSFVDRFAQIYTPIVFGLAILFILLPPLLGWGSWHEWLYRGLELLVIACPCALVISTPVAIVSAIGNAAKNGVLIKGGVFLEIAGQIKAVAFDKTGTLTEGKLQVTKILASGGKEEKLLSIARTIEEYSKHPIGLAMIEEADRRHIGSLSGTDYQTLVGRGAQATIENCTYYAGNQRLFEELKVSLTPWSNLLQQAQSSGHTPVLIGTDQEVLGIITVADTVRLTSKETIEQLKRSGILSTIMLTGDHEGTARKIANEVGIDEYWANLLPEDKVDRIQKYQQRDWKIGMVGDGMNDAPALATADLGIAMGGVGTDTAMETADVVLMADNIEKLPFTLRLSRKTRAIIQQNIVFSLTVKLAALLLIFPNWLTLWIAVLSDTGAALIVILNSMRLTKVK